MAQKEAPQVIYLDQKCWIELSKIQFGNPSDQDKTVLTKIKQAVSEKRAIFPLTLSNMQESNRIRNYERRAKLASIMMEISRGYSFQPYVERNLRAEIMNIVLGKLGAPTVEIRSNILKRGISNMVGAKGTIVPKKGATPLPDEVIASLLETAESPEALEILLREIAPTKLNTARKNRYRRNGKNTSKPLESQGQKFTLQGILGKKRFGNGSSRARKANNEIQSSSRPNNQQKAYS